MRTALSKTSSHQGERGGVVIILVLILLAIMTVSAFAVSRNALRELAITGNESTGRKASEAADSAMDWIITWANPDAGNSIQVTGTDPVTMAPIYNLVTNPLLTAKGIVQTQMTGLIYAIGDADLRVAKNDPTANAGPGTTGAASHGNMSSATGSLRFFLRSGDYDASTAPELFQTGYTNGTNGFTQKSVVTQAFDIEVRYLGTSLGNKSSGTRAKKQGGLFLIRTIGRANIGSTGQSFISLREALVDYTP